MKRKVTAWLAVVACLASFSTTARAANIFLLGFDGFDYQNPNGNTNPDPTIGYLALGEGYRAVGRITSANPAYLSLDFVNNENTFYVGIAAGDLLVTARSYAAPFIQVDCSNGRVQYWEDPVIGGASNFQYGVNPPNATAPSTFIDGSLLLGGAMSNFSVTYDTDFNLGDWVANVCLDEGDALIYVPNDQRCGWIMAGQLGRPNPTIPQGYDNQVVGRCEIPESTPTTVKSWGAIKNLYR